MQSSTDESNQKVSMRIALDVHDLPELSRVMARLMQIRNVVDVARDAADG